MMDTLLIEEGSEVVEILPPLVDEIIDDEFEPRGKFLYEKSQNGMK